MTNIEMIPIEQLEHHPENPRLDLGDLSELTASIKANGIFQNLTVVPVIRDITEDEREKYEELYEETPLEEFREILNTGKIKEICKYYVVIGNRRLEASKAAGLKALPCQVSDMSYKEQISTMLQENMQRSDLTLYEQAKGIQMMMDLGFDKDQIADRTGFSKSTIERRLAVATLPETETMQACEYGYDLLDLVEISKLEDKDMQKELLKRSDGDLRSLRQAIAAAKREEELDKEKARLRPILNMFAKEMTSTQATQRWNANWEHLGKYDVPLAPDAVVKRPTEEGNYYYYVSWSTIEIWKKIPITRAGKTEAQITLEKKQHDAKELNDRMRENRIAFVSSWKPNKTQENALVKKLWDYVFDGVSKYTIGNFNSSYHNWQTNMFRQYCGMPLEEGRNMEETILAEVKRRGIPMGRAILAWILCGGVKADDREGYTSQYNGKHREDEDLDEVYRILTDNGYVLTEEEQQWKDGTHPFYQEGT